MDTRWIAVVRASADGSALMIDQPTDETGGERLTITGALPSLRFSVSYYGPDGKAGDPTAEGPLTFASGRYSSTTFGTSPDEPVELHQSFILELRRGGILNRRLVLGGGAVKVDYPATQISREQYAALLPAQAAAYDADKLLADSSRMSAAAEKAEKELGLDQNMGEVLGATVAGALVVAAKGGNATEIMGGAMQGLGSTSVDGQALVNAGAMMQSVGAEERTAGRAVSDDGATEGTPSAAGLKPNLAATSACAGFTEGNYQQLALRGGGDTQLDVMCGQAFSLYVAYRRAASQGRAAAELERAYEAHSKSASVANAYARDNAAR